MIRSIVHRPAGEDAVELPVEGHLASFDGATAWLNSDPLTPESLHGRVVLVDFWTYTCVNWLRTLPYLRAWAAKYHDDGLTVIGVHTPEFDFEGNIENVTAQAQALGVEYPIAVDTEYAIWSAFANHYWPALYIADREGRIRFHHFGEGEYPMTEMVIQQLLFAGRRRRRSRSRRGRAPRPGSGGRLADTGITRDVCRLPPEHRLRAGRQPSLDEPDVYTVAGLGCA